MKEQFFLRMREPSWRSFESLLSGGRQKKSSYHCFPEILREISSDLCTAQANGFDPAITERLNRLLMDGNQILYKHNSFPLKEASVFVFKTFPRSIRSLWKPVAACHLLFYGIVFFFTLICVRFPDLQSYIVPEKQKHDLLSMYDPSSEYFLKPREVETDADMFGFYIYNNISIAFRTFAGGIFFGLGSLFFLVYNAVFLGACAGLVIDAGFSQTFFQFIFAHSPFELTGIILSAAAGLILGYNIFRTKGLTRGDSLRRAGKTVSPIIAGSACMIAVAAVIEAFWSSRHEIAPVWHYVSGIAGWSLLAVYVTLSGRWKTARGGL
ncbi:membrane protein [Spirochaetia bacterium]|nr:membrane protein [Spirochaetia bacterium]